MLLHVRLDDRLELFGDAIALERHGLLAIHVHGRHGLLPAAGQRDADVGELRFAGPVDHAAHHRDVHLLHTRVLRTPHGHLVAQVGLDLVRELLEEGARRAPAAGTGRHHRGEGAQAHGLQDLLRHDHLARAIAARLGGERDADGVADAFLQQHAHRGRRGHDALRSHARLGESQVQCVVATAGQRAVDADQVLHRGDLAREHDAIGGKPDLARLGGALQRGDDERLAHHLVGLERCGECVVLVHHAREELGIERAPVHADAHRLAVLDGLLDHGEELLVALRAVADVARVDAVLVEHDRALGHLGEQLVPVEMEVADQGHVHAHLHEAVADRGHLARGLQRVHRDAHDLAARAREGRDLARGGLRVLGVRVRHRLHEDRGVAADHLAGHAHGPRFASHRHPIRA